MIGLMPSFNPAGDRFVFARRPAPGAVLGASTAVASPGVDAFEIAATRSVGPGLRYVCNASISRSSPKSSSALQGKLRPEV